MYRYIYKAGDLIDRLMMTIKYVSGIHLIGKSVRRHKYYDKIPVDLKIPNVCGQRAMKKLYGKQSINSVFYKQIILPSFLYTIE